MVSPPSQSWSLTTHNRVPECIERGFADRGYAQIRDGVLGHYTELLRRTVLGRSLVGSKKGTRTTSALTIPSLGSRTLT